VKQLSVLYDPGCELCCRARRWLGHQQAFVHLDFIEAGSAQAQDRFPGLDLARTLKEITVISDDGRLWRGDAAWITILWSLHAYRPWALRFASPGLRPIVRSFVHQIANQRHRISDWLSAHPEVTS